MELVLLADLLLLGNNFLGTGEYFEAVAYPPEELKASGMPKSPSKLTLPKVTK